jgi:hypothetical protein
VQRLPERVIVSINVKAKFILKEYRMYWKYQGLSKEDSIQPSFDELEKKLNKINHFLFSARICQNPSL